MAPDEIADVYSDERAKDLLLSLKAQLDAQALNAICMRLACDGLRLSRAPSYNRRDGCPQLEVSFVVTWGTNSNSVAGAIERAFEFYDCWISKASYVSMPAEAVPFDLSGHFFYRHRREPMEVELTIMLP